MKNDIIQMLKRVSLTEDEEETTFLDEEDICKGVEACHQSYLGKLYTDKEFPIRML